jgi:hypothetical protein
VLTKAVFVVAAPAALVPLLAGRAARRQTAAVTTCRFGLGLLAPPLGAFALFAALGAGTDFWAANVSYNRAYAAAGTHRWEFPAALAPLWWLFGLALVLGVVRLAAARGRNVLALSLLIWLSGAILGAELGGRGFHHYYVPCVAPAAALLLLPQPRLPKAAGVALIAVAIAVAAPFARSVVDAFDEGGGGLAAQQFGASHATMWGMQFVVGSRVHALARAGDRMFVTGAEPGFYWTARIRPAMRYVYDYVREFRAADWQAAYQRAVCDRPPRFIVLALVGMPEPCPDLGRYRVLLDRRLPEGPVRVLVRQSRSPRYGRSSTT